MRALRTAALAVTVLAVLFLAGSMVVGLLSGGREPAPGAEAAAGRGGDAPSRGRVEVLNAAGRAGLARAGTWVLRREGFDVVGFGNAQGFAPDSSLVLARTGDLELAQRVADVMGIARVREAPDASLLLDVTVVLGADWSADAVPLPYRPAPREPAPEPDAG